MTNNNDFIPADYKIPTVSNYLKLTEGDHTFRVLSSAITGWVYFNKENKPVRSKEAFEEAPEDIKAGGRVNPFWAFVVWNYEEKRIQILELTQKSLMTPIQALVKNPKWGNPKLFDITISRKGTGLNDTEYAVMPNPHSPVDKEILVKFEKANIDLEKLYVGEDPFKQ